MTSLICSDACWVCNHLQSESWQVRQTQGDCDGSKCSDTRVRVVTMVGVLKG